MLKWLKLQPLVARSGEMLHLDALRFVASLGIVFHHSKEFMLSSGANERAYGLALFVDMFFIISGYVISYTYFDHIDDLSSYGRYLKKRVGRLLPLHLLTLILSAILYAGFAALHLPSRHMPSFNALCIADTAILLHSFVHCGNDYYFNGVSWSISVEMVMYIGFPIALVLARNGRRGEVAAIATVCAAIMLGVIHLHGFDFTVHDWTDNLHPLLRGLFGFGVGVALFRLRRHAKRVAPPFGVLGGGVLAIVAAMLTGQTALPILALIILVVTGAIGRDMDAAAVPLVSRIAPFGQLTYSIYMWHSLFILALINIVGDKLMNGSGLAIAVLTVVCYSCIFVTSVLSFHLFEAPMRRAIENLSFFSKHRTRNSSIVN